VFKTGKPYLSNNLLGEKKFATKDLLDKVRTGAWVPLVVDTTVIGVLVVSSSRTIFQDEFELLMPIADMAASAVHRASLSDQTQRRLQHLTTLRTINIAIGASLDLRVTLNVLVNQITTQLGVDAVDVLLLDPDTRSLHYAAGHGFRSKSVECTQLWLGEAQAGRVALERHSQHIYDPKGIQSYFAQQDCLAEDDFVAYDAVPLTVKGEVKGVLETFHRAPYRPSTDWIQLLEALALETAIAIDNAELLDKLQRSNVELAVAYDGTIEGWARALELRDRESENHTKRVADATIRLAQALGISGAPLMHIRRGALLHDIGKMGIPDNILLKPDVLTPDEWIVMRQHAQFAYDMLATIPFLRPALEIPYSHHEHWDGSGYPQGLQGEEIPITARIFSIIDVYDALTHDRPYRSAWPEAKALEYLREQSGVTLDPQIVKVFLDMHSMLYKNK
jgi:putative nucleotidyltransferase with HDIG domain